MSKTCDAISAWPCFHMIVPLELPQKSKKNCSSQCPSAHQLEFTLSGSRVRIFTFAPAIRSHLLRTIMSSAHIPTSMELPSIQLVEACPCPVQEVSALRKSVLGFGRLVDTRGECQAQNPAAFIDLLFVKVESCAFWTLSR